MRPPAIGLESGPALSAGGAGSPVVAVRTDEARQAAAGTRDGSVLLLSVETERVTGAFRAPCEQSAMVFAHDPTGEERILVTGGTDGVIRVWDASGERRSWKAHEKAVTRIEGSRAGSLLSLSVAADEAAVWTLEGIRTTTMTASDATLSRDGTRVGWSRASHAWILSCLDVGTGEEVWSLPGHGASFPGRILDSKGERVVCRSSEGPRIHDLGSGASVPFPAGAPAYTAQFIDDGAVLLANGEAWICSTDGRCLERYPTAGAFGAFVTGRWLIATSYKLDTIRVNVWDRRSGEQILSAPTRRGFMASKSALLEDRVLAVASPSGSVVLHDLASGEPRSMPSSTTHLHALDFSADGSLLLTSGTSEHVELWDVASGRRVARHDLPARRVLDARMDPDPLILAQHYGQGLEITDPRSGRVSRRFAFDDIEMASLSPDGSRVVAASKKRGLVRVWDRRSGDLLLETMGDAASFDDRGGRVVVLSMETRAGVREVATGRDLLRVRRASSAVSAGGLSSDGRRLLTLSQDARRREDVPRSVVAWLRTLVQTDPVEPENRLAMIWDVDSGKVVSTAGVPLGTTQVAEGEGSGSLKVDAPWGGGVRLVDARTGEQKSVSTWAVQKPGEAAIQRAPDPTVLLFSSTSGVVHRLNHPAPVTCEAVGDHGAWVIAGCQDGSVHVWRPSRIVPRALHDHDRPIQGIAWSHDGRMVATWSGVDCIVWSTETALVVARFDALSCERVAFSADGRTLLREESWESEMRGTVTLRDGWALASKAREQELDPQGPWPEPAASPYEVRVSARQLEVMEGDRSLARMVKTLSHASCRPTPSGIRLVGADGAHLAMYALRDPSSTGRGAVAP